MKALSIKQPWAWLICAGYKDVENRTWHLNNPPFLKYTKDLPTGAWSPMRIYVHAGVNLDSAALKLLVNRLDHYNEAAWAAIIRKRPEDFTLGAIIGEVTITGCVVESDSPWFVGPYGFTLDDPVLYDKPIPYRGQLGFFEVKL